MAAIFKIVKSQYFSQKSFDFDEISYTTSDIELEYSHVTKIKILEIQDGGVRHLENRFLAITHRPIVRFQRKKFS